VCVGTMTGGGTVTEPIGRHPKQRKMMAVRALGGKPAITHYRLQTRFAHHTRIVVNLETGRTHQIRVHMAYRKYPLIGDPVYGGRPRIPKGASEELITALRSFPRQALHAQALQLIHPESGEEVSFECPIAQDMLELLGVLEREDPYRPNDVY
jgi:23S rRNA pseudouridine1911/1915/1917 synthase